MALKQGAGRLIRTETDRGVLVIGDRRLLTRSYGLQLLGSLPPMRRLVDEADMSAALDALVFTGGIGEHAAPVRAQVAALSAWLGVTIDAAANAAHARRIDTPASRVAVAVVPTNEERMIARYTAQTLGL